MTWTMSLAGGRRFINIVSTSAQSADFTSDEYFHVTLQVLVNVSRVKVGNSHQVIGHELLADKWMVSPEVARRTLERTAQRGVRTILHPSLSHRFQTNDRQLCYKRLRHDVFADTMQSKYKLHRGELYSQVYTKGFHWCRVQSASNEIKE